MKDINQFFSRVTKDWGWVALMNDPQLAYIAFLARMVIGQQPPGHFTIDEKWEYLFLTAWQRQLLLGPDATMATVKQAVIDRKVTIDMAAEVPLASVIGNDEAFAWVGISLEETIGTPGLADFLYGYRQRYDGWVSERLRS